MEFPQQFPSLTIPTGAGPGSERITINDGQDGAILVYDSTGTLIVSIASAAGSDPQGQAFQAGVTIYSATTAINFLANDGTWTAADGSKIVVEAGSGASIFFLPQSAGGPWFDGDITTMIAGGNHPGIVIASPSDQTNAISSSITLEGSSTGSVLTSILMQADHIDLNALVTEGSLAAGTVSITPSAPNTPTSAVVSYGPLKGTTFRAQCTANTNAPGTVVTGVGASAVGASSATIWLTRTNTTATTVFWEVRGT
jgi:hypothetical protein